MSLTEKMMNTMMGNMKKEDKMMMMNNMMDKFFDGMTQEEKGDMMKNMMPKMMGSMMGGEGMGMMGMMKNMMRGGQNENEENDSFNPMDMCSKMMSNMSNTKEMAEFATPELRDLFQDWLSQIEEEILTYLQEKKSETITPEEIASQFKISKESAIHIVSALAKKGRIQVNFAI